MRWRGVVSTCTPGCGRRAPRRALRGPATTPVPAGESCLTRTPRRSPRQPSPPVPWCTRTGRRWSSSWLLARRTGCAGGRRCSTRTCPTAARQKRATRKVTCTAADRQSSTPPSQTPPPGACTSTTDVWRRSPGRCPTRWSAMRRSCGVPSRGWRARSTCGRLSPGRCRTRRPPSRRRCWPRARCSAATARWRGSRWLGRCGHTRGIPSPACCGGLGRRVCDRARCASACGGRTRRPASAPRNRRRRRRRR
jgi:hypothetical protein